MTPLPPPLVDPKADLRSLPYMPLHVARLKNSRSWRAARLKPELGFYMLNMWMAAWQEVPAGSLEGDDEALREAAECSKKRWPKVRDAVLRGWVKCSDFRLYHSALSQIVTSAWSGRVRSRDSLSRARSKKAANKAALPRGDASVTDLRQTCDRPVTESVTGLKVSVSTSISEEKRDRSVSVNSVRDGRTDWPDEWLADLQAIAKGCQGADMALALGVKPLLELQRQGCEWEAVEAGVTAAVRRCEKINSVGVFLSFIETAIRQLGRAREVAATRPGKPSEGTNDKSIHKAAEKLAARVRQLIDDEGDGGAAGG